MKNICIKIWYILVLLLFVKPQITEDIQILDLIFNLGRFGVSFVYIYLMIFRIKKVDKVWLYIFGIFICVLLSTLRFDGAIEKTLAKYIPALGILAFISVHRNDIVKILEIAFRLKVFLLILNTATCIIFPEGIVFRVAANVGVWLLGQKQDFISFIIPMIFIALFLEWYDSKNKNCLLITYVAGMLTLCLQKPLNVGVLIGLIALGIFLFLEKFFYQKINKNLLLVSVVSLFVLVQYISYNFNELTWLQSMVAKISAGGKIRTLNIRFDMWKFAWNTFLQHPILGVGDLSVEKWHIWYKENFYHSILDNMYIDVIFSGGLVAMILFLLLLGKNFKMLGKFWGDAGMRKLGYCFFVLCILLFVCSPFCPMIFFVFALPMWFPYVKLQIDNKSLNGE